MKKVIPVVLAAAIVGACRYPGDPEPQPVGVESPARPAIVVQMTEEMRFEPQTVRIRPGDTVEWRNASNAEHTVTLNPALARNPQNVELPAGAQPFDSGRLSTGAVYRQTFNTPGRYRYVCLPHEQMGMVGEVIVESR
jgi:plastocyanin